MTQKEAKIQALQYIINCNYAYGELSNDADNYSDSAYFKICDSIDDEINILQKKLEKLKLK